MTHPVASRMRQDALAGLAPLGLELDPARNAAEVVGVPRVGADGSRVEVLVVPTDEELAIARQVRALLGRAAPGRGRF